jgi:hypothetical protein
MTLTKEDLLRAFLRRHSAFGAYVSTGDEEAALVTFNVAHVLAPGNDGATMNSGTGVQSSGPIAYKNESGITITEIALVFCGWKHTLNAADTVSVASYSPTWTAGGKAGVAPTVTPGDTIITDWLTLDAPWLPGTNLTIAVSATPTQSGEVPRSRDTSVESFRPHGILSRAMSNTPGLNPLRLGFMGDSIFNNNGLPPTRAADDICPSVQFTIIGSTLFQQLANLSRRLAYFQTLGVTHIITNYFANDHGAARAEATMLADAATFAAAVHAANMDLIWLTITPKISATPGTLSVTSLTQTGGTATALLSNTAKLAVGQMFSVGGAAEAGWNGLIRIDSITPDTSVTFNIGSGVTSPATGTLVFNLTNLYDPHQITASGNYAGSPSIWANINDAIRANFGGLIDGFIEMADAVTPGRNVCRWTTGETDLSGLGLLRAHKPGPLTVASIINTTRFSFTDDGDPAGYPTNWANSGNIYWISGANPGARSTVSSTASGRQLIISSAPTNPVAIGDIFCLRLGGNQGLSVTAGDGLHPNETFTWGGTPIMISVLATRFAAMKAAL